MKDVKKLVWVVEDEDGSVRSNLSTGTSIYTKKHNALSRINKRNTSLKVVEYELVPTGEVFTNE